MLATVITWAVPVCAMAQGLSPLDAAAYAKAVEAGQTRRAEEIAGEEMPMMMRALKDRKAEQLSAAPFSIAIETPFGRVATTVADTKRLAGEEPPPSLDVANAGGIVVKVTHGDSIAIARNVKSVSIRRGDAVIGPSRSTILPTALQSANGVRRTVTEGEFTFGFAAFQGTGPITIVVITEGPSFEWTMTRAELKMIN
jgi:hypothetical protein